MVKGMVILCNSFKHRGCVISIISNPTCGCWFPLCVWSATLVCGRLCESFFSLWSVLFFFSVWSVVGVGFLCVVICGCCFTLVCGRLWEMFFLCGQCSW